MKIRIASLFFFAISFSTLALHAQTKPAVPALEVPAAENQSQGAWQKADPKRVCMVTNMLFPSDQIPVKVKDTTYYGCCENCKDRLAKDDGIRKATDPISGKSVDKAKASIAAGPDGSVEYFENDGNLQKFIAGKK